MRGKKGVETAVLLIFILLLIVFLALSLFVTKIGSWSRSEFDDWRNCRLSVQTFGATNLRVAGQRITPELLKINCPTRIITIGDGSVMVNGRKASFWDGLNKRMVDGYEGLTPDLLYNVFTDELVACWWAFQRGEKDFLGEVTLDWGNNNRLCHVCSDITITAKDFSHPQDFTLQQFLRRASVQSRFLPPNRARMSAYDFLFKSKLLADRMYKTWPGHDGSFAKSDPSLLRYLDFHSKKGVHWTGEDVVQVSAPFADPDLKVDPSRGRRYVVLFIREGGSWTRRLFENIGNKLMSVWPKFYREWAGWNEENAREASESTSTYAIWVVPSEKVTSEVCNGFFG